jgi:threonine dehydratase
MNAHEEGARRFEAAPRPVGDAMLGLGSTLETTPLQYSPRLSDLTGRSVWLKREDLQPVRSYKVRGALAFIEHAYRTTGGKRPERVVAASAGNHAQGVAWCAAQLGIDATVVLPERTPRQKRERIQALGGDRVRIELTPGVFDDAACRAQEIADGDGALLIPAFDHPAVIAGQGGVAREVLAQLRDSHSSALGTDAVFVVPVGGGGLAAGCRHAIGGNDHRWRWQLVCAEPKGAASLHAAWQAGRPVPLADVDLFVDGAAVRQIGEHPWSALSDLGGRVPVQGVVVDEGAISSAMIDLYQTEGIIAEPAGALSVAALVQLTADGQLPKGAGPVVCVISGGNNDVSRYGEVLERSLVHRGLKHYFLVEFPQQPGALRRFLDEALGPDDDIVLFEYVKKSNRETGPALVGIELARPNDLDGLLERLAAGPARATRLEMGSPLARLLL